MLSDESRLILLRALSENPELSQRQMAKNLGLSLGKVNYCLNALIDKGLVKASNFRKNPNKTGYLYQLTPMGIEQKTRLTVSFLQRKMSEYEQLEQEIAQLREEVRQNHNSNTESPL